MTDDEKVALITENIRVPDHLQGKINLELDDEGQVVIVNVATGQRNTVEKASILEAIQKRGY